MKTFIAIIVIALVGVGAWFMMKNPNAVEMANTENETAAPVALADGSYTVSTTSSSLIWEGSKPLIPTGYFDRGTIDLRSGILEVEGGNVASGTFTIDMATIAAAETSGQGEVSRLTDHLQSADFFDVETYPTATFTVTDVSETGEVTGNLTIKGTTREVTFPAEFSQSGDTVTATAEIEIDRTLWDIRYGSGKFFQDLGDNLIADTFTVTLNLVAERDTEAEGATTTPATE